MSDVTIRGLNKRYGQIQVLHDIDLDIRSGEFVVLLGPSGCGKSTLLRCISGLESITSGGLMIEGRRANDVPARKRGIAMVFQSYALYPHMTVRENMAYGLKLRKMAKARIDATVDDAAERLQLTPLLDRLPKALSGGQRQRVAIGRAIVQDPKLFLFDEPLSNLDAALRVRMRIEIAQIHRQLSATTMIYVTHDQVEAMTMADRIVVLEDGHIRQIGKPLELYRQPNSLFVAGFIGSPRMNFITGPVAQARGAATIGVRPEALDVTDPADAEICGEIIHSEELGAGTFLYVRGVDDAEPLVVHQSGRPSYAKGTVVGLRPVPEEIHRFGIDGKRLGDGVPDGRRVS